MVNYTTNLQSNKINKNNNLKRKFDKMNTITDNNTNFSGDIPSLSPLSTSSSLSSSKQTIVDFDINEKAVRLKGKYIFLLNHIDQERSLNYVKNWESILPKSLNLNELLNFIKRHKKDCLVLQTRLNNSAIIQHIKLFNRTLFFQQIYDLLTKEFQEINTDPFYKNLQELFIDKPINENKWLLFYCIETNKIEIYKNIKISNNFDLGYAFHLFFSIDCHRIFNKNLPANQFLKQLNKILNLK